MHLLKLIPYKRLLSGAILAGQPDGPVPEVFVDPRQRLRAHYPRRLQRVRFLEDEVDFDRSAQHQHVARVIAQPVPLLRQRLQRRHQLGQGPGHRRKVCRLHLEVIVRQRPGVTPRPRPGQGDSIDSRMDWKRFGDPLSKASLAGASHG